MSLTTLGTLHRLGNRLGPLAVGAILLLGPNAHANDQANALAVVSRGGAYQDAQRQVYFAPFTQSTGIALKDLSWDGGIGILRAKTSGGVNDWDLVQVASDELLVGCQEGLFDKLDWSKLGTRDHYLPQAVSDCGVGALQYNSVLAWDRDKFQGIPTWSDFWDVAKHPGKRGLHHGPKMNLEIALMADGVAPGDVYKILSSDEGVDRAFRKLDQLKPYLVWWEASAQAPQLLGSGEALMTTADNARITDANAKDHRNFGLQWQDSLYAIDSWVILKNADRKEDAYKLLAFMGDPKRQAELTKIIPYGGTARGANDGMAPDVLANSPTNPDNLKVALQIDDQFWRDHLDKLTDRFNAWVAK